MNTTLTTLDIPTLHRNMIGIDRLINRMQSDGADQGYPPYNVIKQDEDHFVIEVALAGFGQDDIEVTSHNGVLTINGDKIEAIADDITHDYLHKGIGNRKFRRTFNLADHVEVKDANMENGILSVKLERNVPEELKPRNIPVTFV